jgi:hypothetical protein
MPREFGVPETTIRDVMLGRQPPSAYSEYLAPLHNRHVIGVNNAYQLGPWVEVVFFGDSSWYLNHRSALLAFKGIKVTCNPRFANKSLEQSDGIRYIPKDHAHTHGISPLSDTVSWNTNSGAASINLAVLFGAKRIVLLGFDMKLDSESISHWHGKHIGAKRVSPPFSRHMKCFPLIADDAKRLGVEIINASLDSMIEVFPKMTVNHLLAEETPT